MMTDYRDPRVLLCETCGYSLEGLPQDAESGAACPECGTLIRESLAEVGRRGSAWQRGRGIDSFLQTAWQTLWTPRETFRGMQVTHTKGRPLAAWYLSTAALLIAISIENVLGYSFNHFGSFQVLAIGAVLWAISASGLLLLTWIEAVGIRFFGSRRGWRITKDVAWTICEHACVGWLMGAMAMVVVAWVFSSHWSPRTPFWGRFVVLWRPVMIVVPFFAGMLVFETLVYVGVRRCRYANVGRLN